MPLARTMSYLQSPSCAVNPWDPMPANFYPLSVFGETIATLSDVLRPKGILCIINTNYRLEETAAWLTHHYVEENVVNCNNFVPLFDRNGTTLPRRDMCVYRTHKVKKVYHLVGRP